MTDTSDTASAIEGILDLWAAANGYQDIPELTHVDCGQALTANPDGRICYHGDRPDMTPLFYCRHCDGWPRRNCIDEAPA